MLGSDLISEECKETGTATSLHGVDMFVGELSALVRAQNNTRSQLKHVIGPKVTMTLQVTGVKLEASGKTAE